jgi:hypothetical protein
MPALDAEHAQLSGVTGRVRERQRTAVLAISKSWPLLAGVARAEVSGLMGRRLQLPRSG